MRRREFVTLLGGAAVAYPLAVRAQKSDQLRRVAVLGDSPSTWNVWIVGFAERLRELGWIEDRTIAIEYHWSEGRPERVAEAAAEFVQRKPDVIVTYGGAALVLDEPNSELIHVGLSDDNRTGFEQPLYGSPGICRDLPRRWERRRRR